MVINYQDKNLIVTYLQIFLSEYLGLTIHKVVPRRKSKPADYKITSNDPLIVTGYFNLQTYSALALYMAYNYPNEGYPIKWIKSPLKGWVQEDYIYQGDQKELVKIISDNMEYSAEHKETVYVPERVLSYIFNEVVTPASSPEEILRIKQMVYDTIYSGIDAPRALDYTDELFNTIIDFQQKVVNKYTIKYKNETETIVMDNNQTVYQIGKQIGKVSATSTEKFSNDDVTVSGNTIVVDIQTNEIKEATVIYSVGGQTEAQTTTLFTKINNSQWELEFENPIGEIEDNGLTVIYEELFRYNTITGEITFMNYKKGKSIEIVKNINEEINFPTQFINFKVTGYVDPWTELLLKEGYEDGDS